MSKDRLITETDAEELISTTKIKSSSLHSNSCTRLTISGNKCFPKLLAGSENINVQEGVKEGVKVTPHDDGVKVTAQGEGIKVTPQVGGIKVTPQGEVEDFVEPRVDVLKIVQDKVSGDLQLLATKNLPRVEALSGGVVLCRNAASKRKLVSEDEDGKISSTLSKFHWSQDVAVQNVGISSLPSTGETKSRHVIVILRKIWCK
jgi:hypothetical protein